MPDSGDVIISRTSFNSRSVVSLVIKTGCGACVCIQKKTRKIKIWANKDKNNDNNE